MRISDWSSDVCSSDLRWRYRRQVDRTDRPRHGDSPIWKMRSFRTNYQGASARDTADRLYARNRPKRLCTFARLSMRRLVTKAPSIKLWVRRILLIPADRKSVVEGKSVPGRLVLCGRGILTKKNITIEKC